MNLVEGNIAGGMGSDGYFGSTSHITIARNWFTATHPTAKENLIALNVGRWNNYFNVVGNILGTLKAQGYLPTFVDYVLEYDKKRHTTVYKDINRLRADWSGFH